MLRRTKRQLEHVSGTYFCLPGQQCCYNESEGLLLIGPPSGGTIDFVSPSSKVAVAKHFRDDVLPHFYCSSCANNMCDKYYKFRMTLEC